MRFYYKWLYYNQDDVWGKTGDRFSTDVVDNVGWMLL